MRAMNDAEKLIRFIWVDSISNKADMMTETQPASIGKPQRESVMGSEADQNHFGGTAKSPELTTGIQRHTILHSTDGGLNWHMKAAFNAKDIKKLEQMVWNFDGTCQTPEPPKPDKIRVFRVSSFSESSDKKTELKTKRKNDNLPLSQTEESHTLFRANTLKSNVDSMNIGSSNGDRENHSRMNSYEVTEAKESVTAKHDQDLQFEVNRIYSSSVKILDLQSIIQSALMKVGDMNVKEMKLEFMSRSREACESPAFPQDGEGKAVLLAHKAWEVVTDVLAGKPDVSIVSNPIQEDIDSVSLPTSNVARNQTNLAVNDLRRRADRFTAVCGSLFPRNQQPQ